MRSFFLQSKYLSLFLISLSIASTAMADEEIFAPVIINSMLDVVGSTTLGAGVNGLNASNGGLTVYGPTTLKDTTQYGVLIGGGASNPITSVASSTAGQVLTANASGAPTWQAGGGGGSWSTSSTNYTTGGLNIGTGSSSTPGSGAFSVTASGGTVVGNGNLVCTSVGQVTGRTYPISASWSPNGQYLAEVDEGIGANSGTLTVYLFSGSGLSPVGSPITGLDNPTSVSWSPDGQYLAVGVYGDSGQSNGSLKVYSFSSSGINPTVVSSAGSLLQVGSVAWSPSGGQLAAGFLVSLPFIRFQVE